MTEQSMGVAAAYGRRRRRVAQALAASLILTAGIAAGAVAWQTGRHSGGVAPSGSLTAPATSGSSADVATVVASGQAAAASPASAFGTVPPPTTFTVYLVDSQAAAEALQPTLLDPHAIAVADGTPDELAQARLLIKQLQLESDGEHLRVIDLRSR